MEGATLNIRFQDDTAGVPQSPATTPQQGTSAPSLVQGQQDAITAAGGVANVAARNLEAAHTASQPLPVATVPSPSVPQPFVAPVTPLPPAVTTAAQAPVGEAALVRTVQQLQAADPRATAEELARLLGGGITTSQVQRMMAGASAPTPTAPPPVTPSVPAPVRSTTEDLVESTRRMWSDNLASSTAEMWQRETQENEARARNRVLQTNLPTEAPRPPPLGREAMIQEGESRAPPRQGEQERRRIENRVEASLGQITALASQFGRVPAAIAGTVTAAAGMPGVAGAIGAAAPALITAAPFIAAATAAIGVPAAAIGSLQAIAQTAQQQIGGLSPAVASAEAQAEIRQLLANQRTAARLGDEVAANIGARSSISASLQGLRDSLVEGPLRDLNDNLKALGKVVEFIDKTVGGIPDESRAAATSIAFGRFLDGIMPGLGSLFGMGTAARLGGGKDGEDHKNVHNVFIDIPKRPDLPPPFGSGKKPLDPKETLPAL